MKCDNPTETSKTRWYVYVLGTLAILSVVVLACIVRQIVSIQVRLSRNGAIAGRLVDSLHSRFPGITFRGGPNYKREVIYINVEDHLEKATKREIEQWLREQKTEQKIEPEIALRFAEDYGDDSSRIRIGP